MKAKKLHYLAIGEYTSGTLRSIDLLDTLAYELSKVKLTRQERSKVNKALQLVKKYDEYIVLHENISRLSIKYQEVIVLRFFEDKPVKEIGEILGKSEGTVKSLLHRGLEKLAKLTG